MTTQPVVCSLEVDHFLSHSNGGLESLFALKHLFILFYFIFMNGASVELKQCCSEGWRSSDAIILAIVPLVAWCFEQWTTYLVLSGGIQAVLW